MTWITDADAQADTQVALLVFWRGRPGWWMTGPNGNASASVSDRTTTARAKYGDISLSVSFDAQSRVATLAGQKVALASNNVVIFDGIDSPEGGKVVKMMAADGTMEDRSFFAMVRRSPVLISFLQCDVGLPDPKADTMARQICSMLGK